MKFENPKTLSYYDSIPQTKAMDLSNRPIKALSDATKDYRTSCGIQHPDSQAASFYALNHCASVVRSKFTKNELLPTWAAKVMDAYSDELLSQSERMTHYMISILTREMRHIKAPSTATVFDKADKDFNGMGKYCKQLKDCNENDAVLKYMNNPPKVSMGEYVGGMEYLFRNGSWSHGFGGKAWAEVAAPLLAMLKGETSLEMMVDTAYTLAHNNGPIFNKGMMYENYTGTFSMILDIQHSGQIPSMFLDPTVWASSHAYPDSAKAVVELVKENVPGEFGDTVNWQQVVDMGKLGKVGNYSAQILKQAKLAPTKVVSMFNGKPAKKTGVFQVMPGLAVDVYSRKSA